jgi:hypothetical protein
VLKWGSQVKFKGKVKIPELDSPGVPAVILIEDPQMELYVEGESLGRWSLVDVRADRLIASAFSLNLGDEELTFIAEDPIDFAYGGVEQMANVWARYRTMTMPRRMVATSRSRKGTKPSRIGDLRSAIQETLSGPPPAANLPGMSPRVVVHQADLAPPERVAPAVESAPEPAAIAPVAPAPSVVPEAVFETEAPVEVETPREPVVAAEPPKAESTEDLVDSHTDLTSEDVISPVVEEDVFEPPPPREPPRVISMGPTVKESIFKDVVPWAKKKNEPPPSIPAELEPAAAEVEVVPQSTAPVADDIIVPDTPPPVPTTPDDAPQEVPAMADPPPKAPPEPEPRAVPKPKRVSEKPSRPAKPTPDAEPDESVPWLDPSAKPEPTGPRHLEPAAIAPDDSSPSVAPDQPRYVVDLGAFEQHQDAATGEPQPTTRSNGDDDRVLEPAMSASAEKSGIMGAVRSAFVRSRDVHEHEYVSAPGGMGIVRNICAQCGHISIGVSE